MVENQSSNPDNAFAVFIEMIEDEGLDGGGFVDVGDGI